MPDSTSVLVNQLANPPSPFDTLQKGVGAVTALKDYQAKQAIADAYSQAIDPTTGQVDQGKFNALMRGGAASWAAGPAMQQQGQAMSAQGAGVQQDVAGRLSQINAAGSMMYPLLQRTANGDVPSAGEIQSQLDIARKMGLLQPGQYQQLSSSLPGMSPEQRRGLILGANMGNEGARSFLGGNVALPDVGGAYQPTQLSPLGAKPASGPIPIGPGVVGVTLTVGTQTIPNVPYNVANAIQQNPDLLKTYYPQQYAQMHPGDQISVAAPSGGAGGGGTLPGHYPAPAAAPAAPVPSGGAAAPSSAPPYLQPPPPPPPEAGGVGLSPQPGYVENVVQPSQKAATALLTAAKDTPNVAGLINDMRAQVNQPGWNPGLGAQAGSTWRQVLDKVGINATGQTPDQQKMAQASYDEFSKDANLIASRQLGTLGNPSDARQSLAEAITPGMAQSKEGVLGISATLLGNQDAINRTSAAWQDAKAAGWSDGQHNQWISQKWNATDPKTGGRFDPRVFWLADTEGARADQARRFAAKIPAGQQAQFLKNVQYAKDQGWVKQNDDGSYAVVNP